MGDMLSQEEINALLKGMDEEESAITDDSGQNLSDQDKDAIGEISNISMGTAATTLFALVDQKVNITTPTVSIVKWEDIKAAYDNPAVMIQITYTEGLKGSNIMILKESDVKVITGLMMGEDGTNQDVELSELHLSAISEAMNQMIGSAATSLSSMFNKRIDIAPPNSTYLNLQESFDQTELADFLSGEFIRVSFRLQIGDLVDSEMMQLYPMEFADEIMDSFAQSQQADEPAAAAAPTPEPTPAPEPQQQPQSQPDMGMGMPNQQMPNQGNGMPNQQMPNQGMGMPNQQMPGMNMNQGMGMNQGMPMGNQGMMNYNDQYRNVEVQQAQFQNFDMQSFQQQKENIDLIMDVPLEVTVELGRTHRSIKEILEFAPGTIIELNKLAGEPIDVLVNGKVVAKGEVVVIAENFSIRLTEIIKDSAQIL